MPRPRLVLLASLACCSLGCAAGLAHDTAPVIGCEPDAVTIADSHTPWEGPSSWTAICAEQRWFCSRDGDAGRVICTEDPRPVTPPSND